MKRICISMLVAMLLFGMQAIGAQGAPESVLDTGVFHVGVSKIVTHPALDAIEQGMKDYLAEAGIQIEYDVQSANGDISTANSIAQKFKADKADLVVGIGTPVAQALANVFTTVPVVFGGITDPLAAGLVPTYAPNSGNVGGASDKNPVFDQIKLFAELTGAKSIGLVFTSGEANGVQLKDMAQEACTQLGLEFVPAGVSNSAEVRQALLSITKRIDGLYIGTDNTVVSAISTISDVCDQAGIPYFTADPTSAEGLDFFMAWGFNYYTHGRKTGEAVAQVLTGKKTAGELGTIFSTDPLEFELWFNLDVAKKLGIRIPKVYLDSASVIYENGRKSIQ
ncbi:MAG: ABC transporter substrate-binding protein [Spirochaetae bacterium HGW-Spirochaetae-8]|nr:MAG: ABC transporter substrate-binding protein [Spirochaetae bacterium HGW-Spirochaetae-8]